MERFYSCYAEFRVLQFVNIAAMIFHWRILSMWNDRSNYLLLILSIIKLRLLILSSK